MIALKSRQVAWVIVAVGLLAASAFTLVFNSSSASVVFRLGGAADTYVSTTSPTTVYGHDNVIRVSKVGAAESWGMASFNVNSKLQVSDVIASARIKLLVSDSSGAGFPATMVTGRLLADFIEGTTTYATIPASTFDASTSTVFARRPPVGFTVMVDVTQQLMKWRSTGQTGNFAVLFTMARATVDAAVGFASRENPSLEGPVLQVFTVPPGQYGYLLPSQLLVVRADT